MKSILKNSLVPFLCLLIIACPEKQAEPDSTIRGYVYDNSGSPRSDVKIVYDITLSGGMYLKILHTEPQISISYSLEDSTHVLLWIENICNSDTIAKLIDDEQPSGHHSVIWNGRDDNEKYPLEDVYLIRIKTGYNESTHYLFHENNYSEHEYLEINSIAKTDQDGYFEFSQECIPFGFEQTLVDSSGNEEVLFTVPRTIVVWAIDTENGKVNTDTLIVDIENGLDVSLQF